MTFVFSSRTVSPPARAPDLTLRGLALNTDVHPTARTGGSAESPRRGSARARRAAPVELALGATLRRFYASEGFRRLGFVRLGDYVGEQLGVSLRTAQELMRIDGTLAHLPLISAAFRNGEITSGHVRLLTRVATPEQENLWLSRARRMDVRRLARAVAAAGRETATGDAVAGDPPAEEDAIPLEIRAPAWLMRWWRETVTFVGQLVGRALPPGACLEVVLAESASGSGAALAGPDGPVGRELAAAAHIEAGPAEPATSPSECESPASQHEGEQRSLQEDHAPASERIPAGVTESTSGSCEEPSSEEERHDAAKRLDASLRDLIASRQREEADLASHLACVRASGSFLGEGCRSLEQYARERLGLSARQMYYLLSLNRTLERLPDLARAFVAGRLTLRQTLLCGRVADKATTTAWVKRAEGTTLRRLEDEVAFWELLREERPEVWGLLRGGPIPEGIVLVPGRNPRLHAFACGTESSEESVRREQVEPADLHTSARPDPAYEAVEQGVVRGGGSLHTKALDRVPSGSHDGCEHCGEDGLHASACVAESSEESFQREQPVADDLHVCAAPPPVDARSFLAALEADERALPLPERRCTIRMRTDRGTRRAWADSVAAYRSQSAVFLEEWEVLALFLREFWKTWDNAQTRRQRRENPALEREGWRCAVPGCRSVGTGRLNTHHVIFKSHGGALTDPGNLSGICRGHHVALHDENWIRCTGTAPDELVWELGVAPGAEPFLVFRGETRVGGTAA